MLADDWVGRLRDTGEVRGRDLAEVLPELVEVYTPEGFDIAIREDSRFHVGSHGPRVVFNASLTPSGLDPDDDYTPIGSIERELFLGAGRAIHHELLLPLRWQGRGIGTDCVRRSVVLYDQLGVGTVELQADMYGKYVWAMCGFTFALPGQRLRVVEAAQDFADRLGLDDRLDLSLVRHPVEIAMLDETVTMGQVAEARALPREGDEVPVDDQEEIPVGKAIMLFGSIPAWEGILDIRRETDGRRLFDLYTGRHG